MKYTILNVFIYLFFLLNYNISYAQVQRPIGTNIAGVVDWSEEFAFVDVMNQSREWTAHGAAPGSDWSSGVNIPLGTNGYPLEIPYDNGINAPQGIRTLMYFGDNLINTYPEGNYRLIVEGTGQIQLWGAASGTFQCPVNTSVFVDNALGGIALEILESQAADPIHDIRFIMPGYENVYETNPFHPSLLEFLEDFQSIRFMDWMQTNNSVVEEWADRNTVGNYTQTMRSGVAYEHMIDLSNLLQKDLWVNVPHRASDDFIVQFARLLRDNVDSNLKIYVEYSNEVWNSIFTQNQYSADEGLALGYSGPAWERSWKYTAKRSADIFQIFENEFADDSRFIKTIASQAANSWVTNYIIERFNETLYNPTQVTADAVAIAPYFEGGVANEIGEAGLASTITVEAILDSLELSLIEAFAWMDETKIVADNHELDMIAYEGGQHLVAYPPYSEDADYVAKLLDVNRHPRMEGLYCDYFDYWYDQAGGGMFANFSSHGNWSKYGTWGIKETYDDIDSPKYLSLQNCVFDSAPTNNGQQDSTRMYMFGHSLVNHFSDNIPTDEGAIAHWMYLFAQADSEYFASTGQFTSIVPGNPGLPPSPNWGYSNVPPVWDNDVQTFSDANFNHILITALNYVQDEPSYVDYPYLGSSVVSTTETIFDWTAQQEDSLKYYIYENWPDMSGFLNNGFPASEAEFAAYNQHTVSTFNNWWLEYQDLLLDSRPQYNVRMIPVGPIISKLHTDFFTNPIPITELYEDDAPHGTQNTYFLAGLISYMGVFQEPVALTFNFPNSIHPQIRDNFGGIVDFIWTELNNFNLPDGSSRVFFEQSTTPTPTANINLTSNAIKLLPNPTNGLFTIVGTLPAYTIEVLDVNGNVHQTINNAASSVIIDINLIPAGLFFIRISNQNYGAVTVKKILKMN